jgi:transposase
VLTGITFMLLSSCSWANLPAKQLGCGSPVTCWRRVRDWQQAGVWDRLHRVLLAELRHAGQLDFSRCSLDSVSVRAKRAGELTGGKPGRPRKRGSKYHLLVERGGVPLAAAVSAANTPDAQLLEPVVDAVPPVKGRRGRPRRRPVKLHTDKAYDSTASRRALRRRGITGTSYRAVDQRRDLLELLGTDLVAHRPSIGPREHPPHCSPCPSRTHSEPLITAHGGHLNGLAGARRSVSRGMATILARCRPSSVKQGWVSAADGGVVLTEAG